MREPMGFDIHYPKTGPVFPVDWVAYRGDNVVSYGHAKSNWGLFFAYWTARLFK